MPTSAHDFAENLVDDLRAAQLVRERDAQDTGNRQDLDGLISEQGFKPEDFA